jgi:hypothetical protein
MHLSKIVPAALLLSGRATAAEIEPPRTLRRSAGCKRRPIWRAGNR